MSADLPVCIDYHGWENSLPVGEGLSLMRYIDGTLKIQHRCDRGKRGVIICAPELMPEHRVTGWPPTIEGSILCPDCGLHGWVREGKWEAA